jgi:CMP-N-acetylneuraminic acid synthetase
MDDMVENKNERVAIILARGGSKRIPNKNIIDFFGKPLIAWTIEAALKTNLFETVLVSTESKQIAEVALKYGAKVPFLRNANYDDFSSSSEATLTALKQLKEWNSIDYKTVAQLMANCPLRTSSNILDQLKLYESFSERKSIISGFKYGMFNPWWAHSCDNGGNYSKIFENNHTKRSQDLPELICPSGATWICEVETLYEENTFYSEGYSFYEMEWKEAVDIDDYEDFLLAKAAYILNNGLIEI